MKWTKLISFTYQNGERNIYEEICSIQPTSLYKVDLQRVRQAGREVDEECEKEDIKTVIW